MSVHPQCDTCNCKPVPDLTEAIRGLPKINVRGAYSISINSDGVALQGEHSDLSHLIDALALTRDPDYTFTNEANRYEGWKGTTVTGVPLRIVLAYRIEATQ